MNKRTKRTDIGPMEFMKGVSIFTILIGLIPAFLCLYSAIKVSSFLEAQTQMANTLAFLTPTIHYVCWGIAFFVGLLFPGWWIIKKITHYNRGNILVKDPGWE